MKTYMKLILIVTSCFLLLILFCIWKSSIHWKITGFRRTRLVTRHAYGNEEFLIKTPGCSLPDYGKYFKFASAKYNGVCGPRAVFIKQLSNNDIVFKLDKKMIQKYVKKKAKITCCYKFASTTPGTSNFIYSRCIQFQNGTKAKLLQEVVTVTCTTRNKKSTDVVYEDSYILLKKINKHENSTKPWNILVLGMSTMSRARVYDTMPLTIQYLQSNKWLDYKGYHTVGEKMLPNIISLLTGKKMTTVNQKCMTDSDKCNKIFIWHHFENAQYVTAFGDDNLEISNEYPQNRFMPPSTDHYVWPYFHAKYKRRKGNFFCSSNMPSGKQLLDYAYQFVNTYKTNNFFGMFWINTFSSRIDTIPTHVDADMVEFFHNINKTGVLKNTFLILLSDHGLNSGDIKTQIESYYEKRLPMFFMSVPYEYQKRYSEAFNNTYINQNRLISPHDVFLTMMDILHSPNFINTSSEACPQCNSLFKEKSRMRKCTDAAIDKEWCACHILDDIDRDDVRLSLSIRLLTDHIQNYSKSIKTIPGMTCAQLHLKSVLRTHTYTDMNKMYYVIALQMSPGNVSYEGTVVDNVKELNIDFPVTTISSHGRGNCAIDPNDRIFCICDITICNKVVSLV